MKKDYSAIKQLFQAFLFLQCNLRKSTISLYVSALNKCSEYLEETLWEVLDFDVISNYYDSLSSYASHQEKSALKSYAQFLDHTENISELITFLNKKEYATITTIELVNSIFRKHLSKGITSEELSNLQQEDYCRTYFGLDYPVLAKKCLMTVEFHIILPPKFL